MRMAAGERSRQGCDDSGCRRRHHDGHGGLCIMHLQEGSALCLCAYDITFAGRCGDRRQDGRELRQVQEHPRNHPPAGVYIHVPAASGEPSAEGFSFGCSGDAQDIHHRGQRQLPEGRRPVLRHLERVPCGGHDVRKR